MSGQDLIAEQIAVLNCFRRNISARLPLSETTFPEGRPLSQIDGFLICLPGNRHTLFWMASDLFFDVDISRMRIPSREQACADIRAAGAAELPVRSETLVRSEAPAQPDTPDSAVASQQPDTPPSSAEPDQPSAKKIGRSDIARLPRKFWPLANNSFLLHGYHNYSHLMLIEEGGRAWLGVPGIYSPQEARAADLFGFPRFTRSFAAFPELAEEERSASSDFGHWCRCVGQNIPFIS